MNPRWYLLLLPLPFAFTLLNCETGDPRHVLLNVSYDATRELYRKLNQAFIEDYEKRVGVRVRIRQSHGGSASQARTVIDGSPADVTSLSLWQDTDMIRRKGLIADGWESRLPERSLPYYSTIVFVVRKGNPKGIHDWPDLVKPGISIISANPKTGGGAKLSLLAAWGDVILRGGTEDDAKVFVTQLYRQVPVLDSGSRGATLTFARRMIGDVHLTWESEALMEVAELPDEFEVIYPPRSIRAEPHVAMIDTNVDRKGTKDLALDYLNFLYTPRAQQIIAEHHFRSDVALAKPYQKSFPQIELFRIEDVVPGGWDAAQKRFFNDGGLFDQIYQSSR